LPALPSPVTKNRWAGRKRTNGRPQHGGRPSGRSFKTEQRTNDLEQRTSGDPRVSTAAPSSRPNNQCVNWVELPPVVPAACRQPRAGTP
jgi:hypothetical protein